MPKTYFGFLCVVSGIFGLWVAVAGDSVGLALFSMIDLCLGIVMITSAWRQAGRMAQRQMHEESRARVGDRRSRPEKIILADGKALDETD
jgi:hypothetical protein